MKYTNLWISYISEHTEKQARPGDSYPSLTNVGTRDSADSTPRVSKGKIGLELYM
jgi:hypothetical protein